MFVVKNLVEFNSIGKNKKIYSENFNLYLPCKKKSNIKYFYNPLVKINNNFKEDFFSQWFISKQSNLEEKNNIEFIQCFSRVFLYETIQYLKLKIVLDFFIKTEKKIP